MVLNTIPWLIEKASGGRIVPPGKEESDPWSWKIKGGILPGWLQRLSHGKKDFWRAEEHDGLHPEPEQRVSHSSDGHGNPEKGPQQVAEPASPPKSE